jgi:N-acyl homoserine lactone hydrolase
MTTRFYFSLACILFFAGACASFPKPKQHASERVDLSGAPELAPCALYHEVHRRPLFMGVAGIPSGKWEQPIASILLHHPEGLVVIDPGMGEAVVEDLAAAPRWFRRAMGDGRTAIPLQTALESAGVAPADVTLAVITHAHWDHTGGLQDLPSARLLIAASEKRFVDRLEGYLARGVMPHHFAAVSDRTETFRFDGPAYEGFAASFDVFGDGSLVAVPLPGHTPGSTGWFVNSADKKRWFFIGDTAWTLNGVRRPAHKMRLASMTSDHDRKMLAESLARIHHIYRTRPEIQVVVSHDLRTYREVPACEGSARPVAGD